MKIGAVDHKDATLPKSNWFVIKLKAKVNFVSTTRLLYNVLILPLQADGQVNLTWAQTVT